MAAESAAANPGVLLSTTTAFPPPTGSPSTPGPDASLPVLSAAREACCWDAAAIAVWRALVISVISAWILVSVARRDASATDSAGLRLVGGGHGAGIGDGHLPYSLVASAAFELENGTVVISVEGDATHVGDEGVGSQTDAGHGEPLLGGDNVGVDRRLSLLQGAELGRVGL